MAEVREWLIKNDLQELVETFEQNNFKSLDLLSDIEESDLKEMGITAVGTKKLFFKKVKGLKETPAVQPQPRLIQTSKFKVRALPFEK